MVLKVSRLSRHLESREDLSLTNIVLNGRRPAFLLDAVLLKLLFHVRPDLLLLRQISADGGGGKNMVRTRQKQRLKTRGFRGGRYAEILTLRAVRKVTLTRHRFMSLLRRGVDAPSASTVVSAVIILASEVAAKDV
jgi:hypothetical protein